jgi:DNA-binding transcriptional ArsR family regulator
MGSAWKALSDDNRRRILLLLKNRDMTPSEIAKHFHFSLPAVSTHLRILREAELITDQKQGKNKLYSLNQKQTPEITKFFESMWGYKLNSLKEFIESREKTGGRARKND